MNYDIEIRGGLPIIYAKRSHVFSETQKLALGV